jgi:hypothetical protein
MVKKAKAKKIMDNKLVSVKPPDEFFIISLASIVEIGLDFCV